jgi:hypothetical protein
MRVSREQKAMTAFADSMTGPMSVTEVLKFKVPIRLDRTQLLIENLVKVAEIDRLDEVQIKPSV